MPQLCKTDNGDWLTDNKERNKMSNLTLKDTQDGKFSSKYHGLWFYYDDEISIYWNRSHTFNVYSNGNEVDCFTVNETMTPKDAEFQADEWLEEQLEEEKREHAPAY